MKYVGEDIDKGVYRITFPPVEDEFNHLDSARDAARHSGWGEDQEFSDYTVEKVKSTVTPDLYPYVCGGCAGFVHTDNSGACEGCGSTDWKAR